MGYFDAGNAREGLHAPCYRCFIYTSETAKVSGYPLAADATTVAILTDSDTVVILRWADITRVRRLIWKSRTRDNVKGPTPSTLAPQTAPVRSEKPATVSERPPRPNASPDPLESAAKEIGH